MGNSKIKIHCAFDDLVSIEKLKPNLKNPNTHPKEQIELLTKIIKNTGWRTPITVSNRSGLIVKGHGRLEAAKNASIKKVPVDYQDYESEEEEWADLLADNRIAELAEWDIEGVANIMNELNFEEFDMELTGWDSEALDDFLGDFNNEANEEIDAEPQIDKAAELQEKWGTELGQLWTLGEHRLLCGDSTSKEDVERLMDGAVPLLMVTDPPYGVEYDPNWRTVCEKKGFGSKIKASGLVSNDNNANWFEAWILFPGNICYVWHAGKYSSVVQNSLEQANFNIISQIIWAKPSLTLSRGDYHWQHEPCWYAVRKGKPHSWRGDRKQTTLWEIAGINPAGRSRNEQDIQLGHGTQKPLECMSKPIRNNTLKKEQIYDPFLGSGTTLIAAEQLGRKCYGMEIDPSYVAVILERYQEATGKTPLLI